MARASDSRPDGQAWRAAAARTLCWRHRDAPLFAGHPSRQGRSYRAAIIAGLFSGMPMQSTSPTSPPPPPEPKKRPWWQKALIGVAAMCVALVVAGGLV
ncbi:penicillin-binding protein, partial [Paraburkholderia sp. SIMBA_050]